MTLFRRFHWLPVLLLAVGIFSSVVTLLHRYQVEARSRAVALVLDYGQFRALSSAAGVPLRQAYHRFKSAGITGVAITEETLGDLQASGVVQVRVMGTPTGREYRLETADPSVAGRLAEYVPRFIHGAPPPAPPPPVYRGLPPQAGAGGGRGGGDAPAGAEGERVVLRGRDGGPLSIPGRFEDMRSCPLGLDPAAVRQVREAGLELVGRLNNPLGLTEDSLRWSLTRVRDLGIHTLIFAGEEVLGFRGLIDQTAALFRELGLIYGTVELGKQRGDDLLSLKLADRLVRVHSIAAVEMARITPDEAIERYVRAAAERNIRLNYVRLPGAVTGQPFEDSVAYVRKLAHGIVDAGFGLGTPIPFERVWPDSLAAPAGGYPVPAALIALGVGAGAALLLAGIIPIPLKQQSILGSLSGAFCAGLALSGHHLGLQAVALGAAVIFPTLAFVLLPQPLGAFEDHKHAAVRKRTEALVPAVGEFAALSAVTLIGALMAAGELSELPFLVKVQSFAGIKVATVMPLLLISWIYLTGMTGLYPSWRLEQEQVLHRLRRFYSEPLRLWHTLAFIAAVAALALVVARSGNEPGLAVSETELRFRALLDRVLGVRPRTKEFLVGHPALLLALAMAAFPRWRRWAFPLLLAGVIGQVGMLNSFCHLHTPLKITLIRTFNGLWIGGLIGLALIWVWLRLQGGRHPAETQSGP